MGYGAPQYRGRAQRWGVVLVLPDRPARARAAAARRSRVRRVHRRWRVDRPVDRVLPPRADPALGIVVLEAEFVGYGASGRNGGWLSAELPGSRETYAAGGMAPTTAWPPSWPPWTRDRRLPDPQHRGRHRQSGVMYVATSAAQLARMQSATPAPGSRIQILDAEESTARIKVEGTRGAVLDPQCARVQPAKLVRGLADVVRARGVRIYERSRVSAWSRGARYVSPAPSGAVRAPVPGGLHVGPARSAADWLPMNSAIVVTEPLTPEVWAELGWDGERAARRPRERLLLRPAHPDGRIALGGRGIPTATGPHGC